MIENLPNKVGAYTARLYRMMASSIDKSFKEKGIPVSIEQFRIMMMLQYCGEKSLVEITKMSDRDSAAITRSIKSLEEKGLVKRQATKEDKRFKKLVITEQGLKAIADTMPEEQNIANLVVQNFTKQETEIFEKLLLKATNNMSNPCKIQMNEN